jgi:hypothetical protein
MTVTIRNPLIRTPRVSAGVVAGAASGKRTLAGRRARRNTSAAISAAPVSAVETLSPRSAAVAKSARIHLRRRRAKYRYSLASLDVLFAEAAEPAEVAKLNDQKDHVLELYVFGFGLLILIASTIGAAVVLRQLIHMASSFMA